jgi:hypothetical protein
VQNIEAFHPKMSSPSLKTEPYSVILPENLEGLNKGKTAVVTGAARGEC